MVYAKEGQKWYLRCTLPEAPQTIFAGIFRLSIHLVSTMAGALTESIISGVMGQNFEISEGTKEMAKVVARETAGLVSNGIVTDIVLAGIDPSGVSLVRVATKIGVLVWKAGAYLHHHSTLQSQLAVCLEEYCEAGYLAKTTTPGDDKATIWQTTSVFRDAKMVLGIYPDIKQYLNDQAFTEAEMRKIGIYSDVSLYADSKKGQRPRTPVVGLLRASRRQGHHENGCRETHRQCQFCANGRDSITKCVHC
jgi:hypothetical protein